MQRGRLQERRRYHMQESSWAKWVAEETHLPLNLTFVSKKWILSVYDDVYERKWCFSGQAEQGKFTDASKEVQALAHMYRDTKIVCDLPVLYHWPKLILWWKPYLSFTKFQQFLSKQEDFSLKKQCVPSGFQTACIRPRVYFWTGMPEHGCQREYLVFL